MAYSRSAALYEWLNSRTRSIQSLADAHAQIGEVDGPGRPRELGRPLAHSYVIRVVAEFQAFVRDLYDLGTEHLVSIADPPPGLVAMLTTAMTRGRLIDAGNATMTALRTDFGRLGIRNLEGKMADRYISWDHDSGGTDATRFKTLVSLRNALAHGNQRQVDELRRQGYPDTVTWGRSQLPVLNRAARALDRIVWDHLNARTGAEPW